MHTSGEGSIENPIVHCVIAVESYSLGTLTVVSSAHLSRMVAVSGLKLGISI